MGAVKEFLRPSKDPQPTSCPHLVEAFCMLGRELVITGAVQVDTCIVSGVVVRHDGTVVLQVASKDAVDDS